MGDSGSKRGGDLRLVSCTHINCNVYGRERKLIN